MILSSPEFQPTPMHTRARRYLRGYLLSFTLVGVFGLGIVVGHFFLQPRFENTFIPASHNENQAGDTSTSSISNADFEEFWTVWNHIKERYVKGDVTDRDLFYGSLRGLVSSLEDPHSVFFPPAEAEQFSKDISGEFEGIGAEIGLKNEQLVVVSPLIGSPAESAGLRAGDKILAIDKTSTIGMDTFTAVSKIRGASGTPVVLNIGRDRTQKPFDIKIVRAKIIAPALVYSLKPGNIAYIRLVQFNQDIVPRLEETIAQLPKNVKGLVIDLRNDPGGYLQVAVQVASKWVPNGNLIVEEKGRSGVMGSYTSLGPQPFDGIKTVVLINKGSASASEILAGALQDYKLATLIGETSFGKGSVQDLESFDDGSALKLTIAEWFTPLGRNINKEGIKPDIEVKVDIDKEKAGQDTVLDRALRFITTGK